jgi:hypothetical protein
MKAIELGQMLMYVNYFDRYVRTKGKTTPSASCLVEITLPNKGANIHAREYQLYLPSKGELQQKLVNGWESRVGKVISDLRQSSQSSEKRSIPAQEHVGPKAMDWSGCPPVREGDCSLK